MPSSFARCAARVGVGVLLGTNLVDLPVGILDGFVAARRVTKKSDNDRDGLSFGEGILNYRVTKKTENDGLSFGEGK
jgi:hypothetical protein